MGRGRNKIELSEWPSTYTESQISTWFPDFTNLHHSHFWRRHNTRQSGTITYSIAYIVYNAMRWLCVVGDPRSAIHNLKSNLGHTNCYSRLIPNQPGAQLLVGIKCDQTKKKKRNHPNSEWLFVRYYCCGPKMSNLVVVLCLHVHGMFSLELISTRIALVVELDYAIETLLCQFD